MQTKTHKLCIKNLSEDGCFEGYASVFDFQDHHGDSVTKGSFTNNGSPPINRTIDCENYAALSNCAGDLYPSEL